MSNLTDITSTDNEEKASRQTFTEMKRADGEAENNATQDQGGTTLEQRGSKSADTEKVVNRLVPDEQLLMESLLQNYHKYSRPVINASLSVVVKFGLTLVQISDMVSTFYIISINETS